MNDEIYLRSGSVSERLKYNGESQEEWDEKLRNSDNVHDVIAGHLPPLQFQDEEVLEC